MTDLISGQKLGSEMCKALGVNPSDVISIRITGAVDEVAQVVITRMIHDEELDGLRGVIAQYGLVGRISDELLG